MKTPILVLSGAITMFAALVAGQALAEPAYATRTVNIRSGPGLDYETVDKLVVDEPVDKGNCNANGTWCYVRHEGTNGWVAAVFLTTTPPGQQISDPPASNPPPADPMSNAYKANRTVNVRSGPGTQYGIVDRLTAGESVTRGQCTSTGSWCYVSHDGADGWVSAGFLTPETPSAPPAAEPGDAARVAVSAVNIRTGPGTSFAVTDRLDAGERVTLGQCTSDKSWCYVNHNGPDGWVSARFLTRPGAPGGDDVDMPSSDHQGPGITPPNTWPPFTNERTGTAVASMPVRGAPNLFTATTGRLERGDVVTVRECSDDGYWCHIARNGLDGWVPAMFLTIKEAVEPAPVETRLIAARTTPIRRMPGDQSQILGMLQAGDRVHVNRCGPAGAWCQITEGPVTGWVQASALKAPEAAPMPPPGQQSPNSVCFTGFGGLQICLNQ